MKTTAVEVFSAKSDRKRSTLIFQQIPCLATVKNTIFYGWLDRARWSWTMATNYAWKRWCCNSQISVCLFSCFGFDIFRAVSMWMGVFRFENRPECSRYFGYLGFMMGPVSGKYWISKYAFTLPCRRSYPRLNKLFFIKKERVSGRKTNPLLMDKPASIRIENCISVWRKNNPVLSGFSLEIKAGEKKSPGGAAAAR